jgi:Na+/H+-translocating membrane pyrophosphatase
MKAIRFALWPTIAGAAGYLFGGAGIAAVAATATALAQDARRRFSR